MTDADLSFNALPLPAAQQENLQSLGYQQMTAIQAQALPLALDGKDLIAQAKTGSGKTASFAIPLLERLNPRDFAAQAIVLCPTRELATQVATEIRRLARYRQNIKVVTLCGGQSIGPQIGSLEHGAHIVVGTPGRIKDHLRKQTLVLSRINCLVLDEADRMLEMGFIDDIDTIVSEMPDGRQTLLFSATFPENIESISARFQRNPKRVVVESIHDAQQIEQRFYLCSRKQKNEALLKVLGHFQPQQAVVFCNTKQSTREISTYLQEQGVSAQALHGDLEQRDRDQLLVQFKQLSCSVLVATDVAARGLDIDDLPAVVNYDMPRDSDNYLHRIGRTGRAGKRGLAVALFTENERFKFERVAAKQSRELQATPIDQLVDNGRAMPYPPYITLCLAGGRKNKIRPGDILGALTGDAGIDGKQVGKITVMDYVTYIAIEQDVAVKALQGLREGKIKGRKFKLRKLQ